MDLSAALRSRRADIESAVASRINAVGGPTPDDPQYLVGLRSALSAAVEYGLDSIERGEGRAPPIPLALASQARAAARNEVGLDTILRRYVAGYIQLAEFALDELESKTLREVSPRLLLRGQAAVFDRLIEEVSAEYNRERAKTRLSREQRRAERVRRLLAGESIDSSDLDYELGAWHVAAITIGERAGETLRTLANGFDQRLLLLRRDNDLIWAWFGSRRAVDPVDLHDRIGAIWPSGVPLAIGEPASGSAGWRLSHRQAAAAFTVASVRSRFLRYADVALLASNVQDDLLATSLHQLYLAPLETGRDGGKALRETLRAYYAAGRNASSASAALGVTRQTVKRRLRIVEARLGRYLDSCAGELEAALHLSELEEARLAAQTHR